MGDLMRQSEHLGSLGVRSVDEDERRQRVSEGETSKLFRIKRSAVVAANRATDHHKNA